MQALLDKYTKLFEADGIIDSEEQKIINEMNQRIAQLETHLHQLANGESRVEESVKDDNFSDEAPLTKQDTDPSSSLTNVTKEEALQKVEAYRSRLQEILSELGLS